MALLRGGWHPYTSERKNAVLAPLWAIVMGSGFLPKNGSVYADRNAERLGKCTQPPGAFFAPTVPDFASVKCPGKGKAERSIFVRDKLSPRLPAVRTNTLCAKNVVGAVSEGNAETPRWGGSPPFWWGKHRVRLYAARTRRGYAPAPPAPKGEKKCSTERGAPRKICAAVNKEGTRWAKTIRVKNAVVRGCDERLRIAPLSTKRRAVNPIENKYMSELITLAV